MGYHFNGNYPTVIGGGVKIDAGTTGDGVLNSEDLNGNGILDTTDHLYSTSPVTLNGASTWQTKRIYIDRSIAGFYDNYEAILKAVSSIRIYLIKNSSSSGRILIDNIRFVASPWKNIKMDEIPAYLLSRFTFVDVCSKCVCNQLSSKTHSQNLLT